MSGGDRQEAAVGDTIVEEGSWFAAIAALAYFAVIAIVFGGLVVVGLMWLVFD